VPRDYAFVGLVAAHSLSGDLNAAEAAHENA
jgi:hypothetical protein